MKARFVILLAAVALATGALVVVSLAPSIEAQGPPQEENAEIASLVISCHPTTVYVRLNFSSLVALGGQYSTVLTEVRGGASCQTVWDAVGSAAPEPACTTTLRPGPNFSEMNVVCAGTRREVVDRLFLIARSVHGLAGS